MLSALLLLSCVASCSKRSEPPAPAAAPAALQPAAAPAAPANNETAPAPNASSEPPPERDRSKPNAFAQESDFLKPGWSKLSMQDSLPLCLFADTPARIAAPFMKDAKKQKLKANAKLTFGVYGPWCLHDACDNRPTLQCWTTLEGDTIHVFTRFFSYHQDVPACSRDCLGQDSSCDAAACRPLDTSCATPELPPGKYTIQHGDKRWTVKLPSVMKDPCLK